ncbi:MAG: cytochrome c oxidase subunit II [Acidobacteria bacterium]|nr:cytochrome c oxidase subunit II [Acidobacteriota bacterium]
MMDWLGMPVAASAHAGDVDRLMVLVHWLMLVLFVGWGGFLLYVLVRFRRSAQPVAMHKGMRGSWSTWIEGGILTAEVILLAFFSIPTWSARVDAFPSEQQSTVVRVVAEQYAWNVHYPGPDGLFGRTDLALLGPSNPLGLDRSDPAGRDDITTINQMHFPVDRPVIVHLSSKDMIHSFALPQMRVKQDAIPGLAQPVWFTPTTTGQWEIACSQLCGLGHYRMRGFYTVESTAEYEAWLAEEAAFLLEQ